MWCSGGAPEPRAPLAASAGRVRRGALSLCGAAPAEFGRVAHDELRADSVRRPPAAQRQQLRARLLQRLQLPRAQLAGVLTRRAERRVHFRGESQLYTPVYLTCNS